MSVAQRRLDSFGRVEVLAGKIMLESDLVTALDGLSGLAGARLLESLGLFDCPDRVVIIAGPSCCHYLLATARAVLDVARVQANTCQIS